MLNQWGFYLASVKPDTREAKGEKVELLARGQGQGRRPAHQTPFRAWHKHVMRAWRPVMDTNYSSWGLGCHLATDGQRTICHLLWKKSLDLAPQQSTAQSSFSCFSTPSPENKAFLSMLPGPFAIPETCWCPGTDMPLCPPGSWACWVGISLVSGARAALLVTAGGPDLWQGSFLVIEENISRRTTSLPGGRLGETSGTTTQPDSAGHLCPPLSFPFSLLTISPTIPVLKTFGMKPSRTLWGLLSTESFPCPPFLVGRSRDTYNDKLFCRTKTPNNWKMLTSWWSLLQRRSGEPLRPD